MSPKKQAKRRQVTLDVDVHEHYSRVAKKEDRTLPRQVNKVLRDKMTEKPK